MRTRLVVLALVLVFSEHHLAAQNPVSAQEQQQREEERRRAAEEKARQEEQKKEAEARQEEFRRMRPPTPAERAAMHKRMFPDFLKDVRKFSELGRDIAAYSARESFGPS